MKIYPEFKKWIHYSHEIEKSILGAILCEIGAFSKVSNIIRSDFFYFDENSIIFSAMSEMFLRNIPIDIYTVVDYLMNEKKINEFNGVNVPLYVTRLTNEVCSTAHIEYHSYILKRMWVERELIIITNEGISETESISEKLTYLNKKLLELNVKETKKDWVDFSELLVDLYAHQDEMIKTSGKGITTGFLKLDDENGGFFGGQFIVIGARPSVGKSAIAGQMALKMAKQHKKVGIISLEMNNNEIAARLTSIITNTDFSVIFRNLFRDENQRDNWYKKINNHVDLPIFISDSTNVNIFDIKNKIYKLKNEYGVDCIFIDYIQLINTENTNRNKTRENEVSAISRGLKVLAKELNIPIIALAQLNRLVTHRTGQNRYPQLSDLRESGSIEQDADVVMFIHRDWMLGLPEYMVDENGLSTENKADLIIRKWRNGNSNNKIELFFDKTKMMFTDSDLKIMPPEETNYFNRIDEFTDDEDAPF